MNTSTTPPASGASSAASRASLPSSTQQQVAQPGQAPNMGIRLPQNGFLVAPATGTPAAPDSAQHIVSHAVSDSPRSRFCIAARNGDSTAVKRMVMNGEGDLNTINPATGMTASAAAHASANSGIGNAATTTAAPPAFLASSTVPTMKATAPATLADAVAANDVKALKRVLTTLRQSGQEVTQHLAGVEKLKTSNPWFDDAEGTPLMAAAHLGHALLVPVLLAAGARVDQAMPDGWTALLFAADQGHTAAVQALLEGGAEIDQADAEGDTALLFAARKGYTAVVKLLLQAKAGTDHANADGETALMHAAWQGHVNTVRALLKVGAKTNKVDADGATSLMLAARDGHTAAVQLLVEAGAALAKADSDGTTALMFAAMQGRCDIAHMLLPHGADPNVQDKSGMTALLLAVENGHDAMARLLTLHVPKSPVATSSSTSGAMPASSPQLLPVTLLEAVERNDAQVLMRLLAKLRKSGKDVAQEVSMVGKLKSQNAVRLKCKKMTPLMAAASFGHEELLALLINAGAKVDQATSDGWTALLWAICHGHTPIVRALLRAGANVNQATSDGTTVLMWAVDRGDRSIVCELLDAGADCRLALESGDTALTIAMKQQHWGIVELLRVHIANTGSKRKRLFKKWFG